MLQMEPSVERNVPSGEPTSAEVEDVRVDPSEKPQQQVREPFRRKRIPRACESCRKKKIKCDGGEVCTACRSAAQNCLYLDGGSSKTAEDQIQKLDVRLQNMEGMFSEFLKKFEEQTRGGVPLISAAVEPVINFHPSPPQTHVTPGSQAQAQAQAPSSVPYSANALEFGGVIDSYEISWDGSTQETQRQEENGQSTAQENHRSKRRRYDEDQSSTRTYADPYGELFTDECGQLRYVGIGSTLSVVDVCNSFRERIQQGLEKKGYNLRNSFLTSIPSVAAASSPEASSLGFEQMRDLSYGHLPPQKLITVLMDLFYERLYFILPVISRVDFQAQLTHLASMSNDLVESDFLPVLYSLLAFSAPLLPRDHEIFDDDSIAPYKGIDLGSLYLGLSVTCSQQKSNAGLQTYPSLAQHYPARCLNAAVALVFQAAYLAAVGSLAEAWISVGQAARLGQDLGLHRSALQLRLPKPEQEKRRYVWWCIYSLDRTLSASLGRPLVIRDADCDVELPDQRGSTNSAGFIAILELRRITGDILSTVASVRTVKAGRHMSKIYEMQRVVAGLNAELQAWATEEVPSHIKSATEGSLSVEKSIALSGYFSALMLLYRFFMGNPHRPSPLKDSEAVFQCARAATNCIRITERFFTIVPVCPDLIFHGQHVFTGCVILLHCIRRSEDAKFISVALKDVETAVHCLRQLVHIWPGALKCTGMVEEYVEFTLECLERGLNGPCAFHHEKNEFTGLELSDGSGRFPPDLAELDLKRLPGGAARSRQRSSHTESNTRSASRGASAHPRSNQTSANTAFSPYQSAASAANGPQVNYGTPAFGMNISKFSLPRQRQSQLGFNTSSLSPVPSFANNPDHLHQLNGPPRSWGNTSSDPYFENLYATTDAGADLLFDNTAPFLGEGFWDLQ